ncbi:MAG: LamG domain-containing protein, partial [Sedimentisphaerales bacterium]|nr:LamG domain-containing protein [Sedimentisphaerales bacterium]
MSTQLAHPIIIILVVLGLVQPGLGNVLDPNLVGWWRFDEGSGTVAADSSGNDLHGTLVNDPLWRQDGPRDGCLFFDGADAYVWIAQQDALNPSDGSFTVTFWGYVEATAGTSGSTNWDLVVAKRDTGSVGYYIGADRNQGDGDETGYRFMLGDNGASRVDTPFVTVPLGEWVFVASVLDRAQNTQKISVDGGQTWETATPPAGTIAPLQDLGIGWDIGSNNFWFHGKIDDVAFFNRALSNGQINLIMQEGMTPALAKDAYPKDGATDVPFDALLSWSPGLYASTHDVYFGTSLADVDAATKTDTRGVLVGPGQVASEYDPGLLTLGQTYYWRVDEVNAPSQPGTFKGEIWSFTVEPVAYAVPGVTVTYSGISLPGSGPENTINGSGLNDDDQHSMELEDMWLSLPGAGPDQLVYAFDRPYSVYEMWVWNSNIEGEPAIGFSLKDVTVEYSLDSTDWILLGEEEFAQGAGADTYTANTSVPFGGAIAQYVRLTINSSWIS